MTGTAAPTRSRVPTGPPPRKNQQRGGNHGKQGRHHHTPARKLGIYLHWNGGRDSVEAFLKYCELREFRAPDSDKYGWARLCQVIANFMGANGLSVGISPYTTDEQMNPGDNGIYVIRGWEVVERVYPWEDFEEQDAYPLDAMLREIDTAQPEDQRLGAFLDAEEVPVSEAGIGDEIFMRQLDGRYEIYPVVGIGEKLMEQIVDVMDEELGEHVKTQFEPFEGVYRIEVDEEGLP